MNDLTPIQKLMDFMDFNRVGEDGEHFDGKLMDVAIELLNEEQELLKLLPPHCCPICGGNGLVSGAFYTSLLGSVGTGDRITEECRSCKGTGIVWQNLK